VETVATRGAMGRAVDRAEARSGECTALPRAEFFIEPPPDTQRRRRRGERGTGVTKGSYLLLTNLSPLPPFPPHTARLLHCLRLRYQDMHPPPS
jgi:hypothetical protein